jgi:hypothetical protein
VVAPKNTHAYGSMANNAMSTGKYLRKFSYGHTWLVLLRSWAELGNQLLLFGPTDGCNDGVRKLFRKILPYV